MFSTPPCSRWCEEFTEKVELDSLLGGGVILTTATVRGRIIIATTFPEPPDKFFWHRRRTRRPGVPRMISRKTYVTRANRSPPRVRVRVRVIIVSLPNGVRIFMWSLETITTAGRGRIKTIRVRWMDTYPRDGWMGPVTRGEKTNRNATAVTQVTETVFIVRSDAKNLVPCSGA